MVGLPSVDDNNMPLTLQGINVGQKQVGHHRQTSDYLLLY